MDARELRIGSLVLDRGDKIAKALGVSKSTISEILNGKRHKKITKELELKGL